MTDNANPYRRWEHGAYEAAERTVPKGQVFPTRGDRCARCGVLVPSFAELSDDEAEHLRALIEDGEAQQAIERLRAVVGCTERFAKIWAVHRGHAAATRLQGPPCPLCGAPLASEKARQCLACHRPVA